MFNAFSFEIQAYTLHIQGVGFSHVLFINWNLMHFLVVKLLGMKVMISKLHELKVRVFFRIGRVLVECMHAVGFLINL